MSIYRGWKPAIALDWRDGQPAPATQPAPEPAMVAKPKRPPPLHLRRAQPVTILLPRTRAWIESLPANARPRALALRFARIVNNICAAWDDPTACRKYFDDLLEDKRGGRQGFPMDVLREIQKLNEHYATVYPYDGCKWDLVETHR